MIRDYLQASARDRFQTTAAKCTANHNLPKLSERDEHGEQKLRVAIVQKLIVMGVSSNVLVVLVSNDNYVNDFGLFHH